MQAAAAEQTGKEASSSQQSTKQCDYVSMYMWFSVSFISNKAYFNLSIDTQN
jgi:hypothetical protein